MAGRASIVGAAATHVGKVREHNEDAHFIDVDLGLFLVCDGMGGHAAGEVASELAIRSIRHAWASDGLHDVAEQWLERGTAATKKQLLDVVRAGVVAAHEAILAEADRDDTKTGMGTTLVGAMVVGGELVFAHAGDSRAYLVRDGISMQLTEDHTLLARLLAAGIDVDVSGEGSRFRSMLTNALGIGDECKVSTFVVPLADGDRFLLCSDGISEYVRENEVGDVLTKQSSPARAAQRLIDLALERGGGDNATAVVVRVLEAGETPLPAEQRKKDDVAIGACALWGTRVTPQQRLRALRIAIPRDHNFGEKLPPHALGDRVAWIIVEGELVQDGVQLGPGALVYPESLVNVGEPAPLPDRDALAITRSDVRALAIRADDFRELCDDDGELGETLLESLGAVIAKRKLRSAPREPAPPIDPRGNTDPHLPVVAREEASEAYRPTEPDILAAAAVAEHEHDRAGTIPDEPTQPHARAPQPESAIIAPAPARAPLVLPLQPPARPSPPPPGMTRPTPSPASLASAARPSPLPARMSPRPAPAAQASAVRSSAPSGQVPTRPSPPPAPTRPSPPPGPRNRPSPPPPPPSTASQVSRPAAAGAPARSTPRDGVARSDAPVARADGSWETTTPRSRPRSDSWDTTNPRSEAVREAATNAAPKSFAPGLSPPTGTPNEPSPVAAPPAPAPAAAPARSARSPRYRRPTDPEIETYLEIEADLPPESGMDAELESELALSIALSGDLDRMHESVSYTGDDGRTRVTETVTETSAHTLTVTVTDSEMDHEPARPRAITAQDGSSVSGTISIPEDDGVPPPRRAKRHSEG